MSSAQDLPTHHPTETSLRGKLKEYFSLHIIGLLSIFSGLVTTSVLWIRFWSTLHSPWVQTGDNASDSIMVSLAKQFQLNHGHYSQYGFFHPGAAMFYFEAWGQWLFFTVLHIFSNENNAQLATILLVNAILISASAFCLGVVFDSPRVVFATCTGLLLYAVFPSKTFLQTGPALFNSTWVPAQSIWCTVFFASALIYLTAKKPSALLLVSIASTFLAQRYLGLVPICFIGLLSGFYFSWRFRGPTWRRNLYLSIAAMFILSLPNLIGIIFDWPWQFTNYFHATTSEHYSFPGVRSSITFISSFWGLHGYVIFPILTLLVVGLAYWVWKQPSSTQRNGYLTIILALVIGTAVALFYTCFIDSGVQPTLAYQLSFYDAIPALAYAGIGILVLRWATAYVAFAAVLLLGNLHPISASLQDIPTAQQAIDKAANGKPIEYQIQEFALWPNVAALLLLDIRSGIDSCAVNNNSQDNFLYSPEYVCTPFDSVGRVRFLIDPVTPVQGQILIYSSSEITVVELPST